MHLLLYSVKHIPRNRVRGKDALDPRFFSGGEVVLFDPHFYTHNLSYCSFFQLRLNEDCQILELWPILYAK